MRVLGWQEKYISDYIRDTAEEFGDALPALHKALKRYQQGEENDNDTENDRENGLRMKNEMTMKEKRFSFFADTQERKAESRSTFGTLPFARHISQRFAKVKEPNLPYLIFLITK